MMYPVFSNLHQPIKFRLKDNDIGNKDEDLSYKIVKQPKEGTITANTSADITYTSTSDTAVYDSFTYTAYVESPDHKYTLKFRVLDDNDLTNTDMSENAPNLTKQDIMIR